MTSLEIAAFSTLPALLMRYDKVGRKLAYRATTPAEHARWRRTAVAKLVELTGYDTFETCPLRPHITEEVELDGYTRQRVEIQTERGVVMPMYVLVPSPGTGRLSDQSAPTRRLPVVLCPHGHSSSGKDSPAGRRGVHPDLDRTIEKHNYDYGVQYAKAGFIAICPDARGMGERQEKEARSAGMLRASCEWINHMAYPLGRTVAGMWAWDLHRLIDYVQTRKDCDASRLGCAGLSGGGLQTLWINAFDNRIKAAVISGYFYGYRESLLEGYGNCSCNFVPRLYEYMDMGDIAALFAPRPLLIETGSLDPLNGKSGLKNVRSQMKITRKAYKTLGEPRRLAHDIFEGEHRWNGVQAIPWMKKWLA